VEVKVKYPVLNQGVANTIASLTAQMAQAQLDRNPTNRLQRMNQIQVQLAQNQAKLYDLKEATHKFEMEATDDMKVRFLQPPAVLDDKGNLRKHTAQDLKDLKGDNPKLPGYTAELADVAKDQIVTVNVARKKEAARPAAKGKDLDAEAAGGPSRLQARMIVIH